MQTPKLFSILPDYICTPDSMAIDKRGNLVLSCPNYADDNLPGVVVRFDKEGKISKWFEVPVHPETGVARNMGIDFDAGYNLYICDNQGWSGRPDLVFKGRVLRVEVSDDGTIRRCVTVANGMEHPNGIKVRGDYMYLTQSMLSKVHDKSGKLVSCVYRFKLTDENIEITNTLEDKNIIATFITQNPKCQYGAD
jgi:sugar lactone lactonase YvrE